MNKRSGRSCLNLEHKMGKQLCRVVHNGNAARDMDLKLRIIGSNIKTIFNHWNIDRDLLQKFQIELKREPTNDKSIQGLTLILDNKISPVRLFSKKNTANNYFNQTYKISKLNEVVMPHLLNNSVRWETNSGLTIKQVK